MFRKTFICAAGVLAGLSAGAYSDGYFEKRNPVTESYQQLIGKLGVDSAVENNSLQDNAIGSVQNLVDAGAGTDAAGSDANGRSAPRGGVHKSTTTTREIYPPRGGGNQVSVEPAESFVAENKTHKSSQELTKALDDILSEPEMPSQIGVSSKIPSPNMITNNVTVSARNDDVSVAELERAVEGVADIRGLRESEVASVDQSDDLVEDLRELDELLESEDEINRPRATDIPNQAELARQAQLEQQRKQMEQAKAQAALIKAQRNEAQAVVRKRFSKEVYENSAGEKLLYRKLAPSVLKPGKLYPLVLFLHGKGQRGTDNERQLKNGLRMLASDDGLLEYPALVIAPQCPPDQIWASAFGDKDTQLIMRPQPSDAMRLTIELLDSIQLTDPVDPDRIYVTGLSMGGFGTFDLVARRPDLFAAAAPLCGGGDSRASIIRRLKRTPWWVIHGSDDEVVNVNRSREMVYALENSGAAPRYSELAEFGHNIWDAAYDDAELYNWMFNQSKAGVIDRALEQAQIENAVAGSVKADGVQAVSAVVDPESVAVGRSSASKTPVTPSVDVRTPSPKASSTPPREAKRIANIPETTPTPVNPSLPPKRIDPQLKPLLGKWNVLAASQKGQQANKKTLDNMEVTFEEGLFTIRIGNRKEATKFRLSKSGKGKSIDFMSGREGVEDSVGIYEMNDRKLIICWGEPGRPRPTKFVNFMNVRSLVLEKQ